MTKIYFLYGHDKYAMYGCCNDLDEDEKNGETFGDAFEECEKYYGSYSNPLKMKNWSPSSLRAAVLDKRRKYRLGDHHTMCGNSQTHLISQNMIDKMGNILERYGVWLPVEIEDRDEQFYRYWVTNEIECLDKEKSKIDGNWSNSYFDINKLIVDEKKFDGSMIFKPKDKDYIDNDFFVTEEFIELIKKHNLKGFEFYRCNPGYTELYYGDDEDCKEKPILIG